MKIIGHRGAKEEAPENTIGGFIDSLTKGVRHFELDLRLTKDEHPVVLHDETLVRTTGREGKIYDVPTVQLLGHNAALHHKNWAHEAVPLLKDLLPILGRADSVQLEIKSLGPNKQVEIIKALRELLAPREKRCYNITSEDDLALKFAKSMLPDIKRGIVCRDDVEEAFNIANRVDCQLFIGHVTLMNKEIIDEIHRRGLEAHVYTVNDEDMLSQYKEWGVDGVITDYPAKFLHYED